jgi:hypothetical protein
MLSPLFGMTAPRAIAISIQDDKPCSFGNPRLLILAPSRCHIFVKERRRLRGGNSTFGNRCVIGRSIGVGMNASERAAVVTARGRPTIFCGFVKCITFAGRRPF